MDKLIKILREEMILYKRLSKLLNDLTSALKERSSGLDVTSSVQAIEPIMIELSKLDKKIQEFLKSINYDNVKDFVDVQTEGTEKNVADSLLNQISNLQVRTRHQLVNSANLLVKSKKFIDYNVNVLSQTVSTNLYGPPGAESESPRRRRIFDANI